MVARDRACSGIHVPPDIHRLVLSMVLRDLRGPDQAQGGLLVVGTVAQPKVRI